VDNLNELGSVLKSIPQYRQMVDLYSLHINMSTSCMKCYEKKQLSRIGEFEQEISTGENSEGKPAKNGIQKLVSLVEDASVDLEDKWRLVLLYSISQDGLKDGERKSLLQLGKLPIEDQCLLINLKFLGINPLKGGGNQRKSPKKSKNASVFQLSRFTPSIKKLAEDLVLGKLPNSEFPITNSLLLSPKSSRSSTNLRKKFQPKFFSKTEKEIENKGKGKFILFLIGGASYSEMRSIYEVASNLGKEVILGSTSIITPGEFIGQIKDLKKNELLDEVKIFKS